jgi:hypothetical protein
MRYAHIRGVWRAPHSTAAEPTHSKELTSRRASDYISETFRALGCLLDGDEYENMLAQWRAGYRETGSITGLS